MTSNTRGKKLSVNIMRGVLGSAGVQAVSSILSLLMGIVLARSLGPNGFGVYAFAIAIMSILSVAAEAGVPTLLMREVAVAKAREKWGLLNGALKRGLQFTGVASITVAAIGFTVVVIFSHKISAVNASTIKLMLLALPAAAMAKTITHGLRGLNKVVVAQILDLLLRPLLMIIIVGTLFIIDPDQITPPVAILGQLISLIVILVIATILLKRYISPFSRGVFAEFRSREWLKNTLPFILIGGTAIIKNQTDIVMIGWFMSTESVGYYRIAVQGALLVGVSLQVVNAVVAPQFARLHTEGDKERLQLLVTRAAQCTFIGALPVALIFVFAGEQLITFAFGLEFVPSYYPLIILAIGQLFHASFGSVGFLLNMTGRERIAARLFFEAALLNVILNAFLIHAAGTMGAALATTISLVVWNLRMASEVGKGLHIIPTAFRRALR